MTLFKKMLKEMIIILWPPTLLSPAFPKVE